MPRRLVKNKAAKEDLIGIWLYTIKNWGEVQAERYLETLERGIVTVAEHPSEGKNRSEIRLGYWSKLIEHHHVWYTFTDEETCVRRVLHEAMEPGRHLPE